MWEFLKISVYEEHSIMNLEKNNSTKRLDVYGVSLFLVDIHSRIFYIWGRRRYGLMDFGVRWAQV